MVVHDFAARAMTTTFHNVEITANMHLVFSPFGIITILTHIVRYQLVESSAEIPLKKLYEDLGIQNQCQRYTHIDCPRVANALKPSSDTWASSHTSALQRNQQSRRPGCDSGLF
ncbi:hypothetical protein ColLi_13251 [Colletotrichum liriopes]|uniref:Uncharacterized protein n=1 Tax=Colletotrichum liriopes TaxID=708192 RepID=A0AA37H2K1_9PEZI|nr:hypothetical protein ColLi_13251 [Colletotrichum liriopes]